MGTLEIPWPWAGRRDDTAFREQPGFTTRAARNVRNRNPTNGRIQGATRSGMVKLNSAQAVSGTRVRALCSTAIDDRKVAYAFSTGAVATAWDEKTPSKTDCRAGRVDSEGNVYALDGNAGIVKFNSKGTQVLKIALPVADPSHIVRALWVDEAGRIFAGVSEGGDVRTARMWCVLQLQDSQYFVLWTYAPGAYTEDLAVFNGSQLYAAHNYTLENRARVLVYEGIGLTPTEAKRIESVAFPISGMALGADGSVYCSSPDVQTQALSNTHRRGHPIDRRNHVPLVGWKPTDLSDASKRIWSWYDAEEIDTTDLEQTGATATLDDGQQILRWRDKSGNNRHFYSGVLVQSGESGPLYRKVGIGGRPCVYFDTGATATTKHSLVTYPNASIGVTLASQQRTAIPAYTGAMWCMLLVIRPTQDDDATTPSPRVVLAMDNQAASASDHALFVNRNAETAIPGTAVSGAISYYATTDNTGDAGGSGTVPPHSNEFADFRTFGSDDAGGAILVTIMWDGGVQPNDTSKTRCVVRYNGRPVDRFEGLAFATLEPTWLGAAPTAIFATGFDVARRFRGEIAEMIVLDRKDRTSNTEPKILTHDHYEPAVTADNTDQTDNELTQLEGYLAYKWGIGQILRNNQGSEAGYRNYTHYYARNASSGSAPAALLGGPPKAGTGGTYTPFGQLLNTFALVSKHDSQGALKWVWNWYTHSDGGTLPGGVGLGVAVRKVESDGKVHVWSCGNQPANAEATAVSTIDVRKVIDAGDSFSGLTADGAWRHTFSGGTSLEYANPKLAADKFGNLFLPGYDTLSSIRALTVFSKDGSAGLAQVRHTQILPGSSDLAMAVALPPDSLTPDYRDDLAEEIAEAAYVFTKASSAGSENAVYRIQLVTVTASATGSPRDVHTLYVIGNDVRRITASTDVVPSGGSAAVSSTAQFVQALRAGDDIVILDGTRYLAYSLRDGTIAALESTSAGEIPPRGQLAMYWRHRLVIGRFADAPGNYAASRLGNIRDWNQRPGSLPTGEPLQTSTQSFSGATTRAGEAEDALVAMIPVWDDLAYLICESRILRLTGDPQDGGNIHKVTDSLGGVFGDSWCKDAAGRVFFFGNKPPGLYGLPVDGDPTNLSEHSLEASEFAAIDFSTHRIVLAWDPIEKGVRIFQVAWGTATIVAHWFWEEATHRLVRQPPIWQDRFYAVGKQPTCATFLGGDDTRALLVGCEDGYVRMFDPDAADDDGDPIDSFVTLGPINPEGAPGSQWRLTSTQVALASAESGCRLELFESETADDIGVIRHATMLKPGLNNPFRKRLNGNHLWLRLRAAYAGRRWALESVGVEIEAAGRQFSREA